MNNFDELKNKIDGETPKRPESLSKENICDMLGEKKIIPSPVKKQVNTKKLVSAAAALIVTVSAVAAVYFSSNTNTPAVQNTTEQETTSAATTSAPEIKSREYEEIEKYFLSLGEKLRLYSTKGAYDYSAQNQAVTAAAALSADGEAPTAKSKQFNSVNEESADAAMISDSADDSYGKTNTQVEGVDEADIIKNDGKYIYSKTDRCTVSITDISDMTLASNIETKSDDEDSRLSVTEMYLNGDKLILLCTESRKTERFVAEDVVYNSDEIFYKDYVTDSVTTKVKLPDDYYYWYEPEGTVILIYDISDKTAPKLIRSVDQDGQYTSSRMVGNILYNVTTYCVNTGLDEQELKDKCVPTVDGKRVRADSIHWEKDKEMDTTTYIIISAFDTAIADGEVKSASMLGWTDNVYCTDTSMFVSQPVWKEDGTDTKIFAFSINGTDITYRTSGTVPGEPVDQFALDEYNGYFRIATTAFDYSDFIDVSSVYVLDGNMKIVGSLKNLKYDESVRSVRFMGNTAYVVTFRNTDPLFVIDMSDPVAPKVKGEVKLPGFSAYLHPVGDGFMVGVGYNGDSEQADYSSVKVSLFNVKNPEKPFEVNNVVIDCASTDIYYDHKAFMYYPEMNYIGIPLRLFKDDDNNVNSFMVLKVTENGLEKLSGFVHQSGDDVWSNSYFRGTYVGNNFFTVSDKLIKRFDLTSFENTGKLVLKGLANENEKDFIVY